MVKFEGFFKLNFIAFCFKVEYEKGQDPTILLTGQIDTIGRSLIALSPDSYSVAVAIENKLCLYKTTNAQCDISIENVCVGKI
jgi:hypothetical protein